MFSFQAQVLCLYEVELILDYKRGDDEKHRNDKLKHNQGSAEQ